MLFLKPFFKTIVFSSMTFLLVVILGMKYHWVSFVFDKNSKPTKVISIDESSNLVASKQISINKPIFAPANAAIEDKAPIFEPIIIDDNSVINVLRNMTKTQLTDKCDQLFAKLYSQSTQKDIFVGNCVVSNFNEVFQESPINNSVDADQLKSQRLKADKRCRSQRNLPQTLTSVEKELLVGICVSDMN